MISFKQFILEDAASQRQAAFNLMTGKTSLDNNRELAIDDIKKILLNSGVKNLKETDTIEDIAEKVLKELEKPGEFKDSKKYMPSLVLFLITGEIKIDVLKDYYDRYINNPKLKQKKSIDKFISFRDFEQFVDENYISKSSSDASIPREISQENAIYHDDDEINGINGIDVYLGDTKKDCILYGQGSKFNLCISRKDSGNLFHNYRWSNGDEDEQITTYFVYFKHKVKKAPVGFIIVDATENSPKEFSYNIIQPNVDKKISGDALIKKFPQLEIAMEKGIFKHKKIEKEEKAYYEKYHGKKITQLKTLNDRIEFIEMGEEIEDNEWSKLGSMIRELLPPYIEIGHDVPKEVLDKEPSLIKRYKDKLIQRVQMNLDDKTDLDDYTNDELEYALGHSDELKTSLKEKAELEGLEIRKRKKFVNGVYKGNIEIKSKYFLPNLSDITVEGNFDCENRSLTSLNGAPKIVKGDFNCSNNNLADLSNTPKIVKGDFNCSNNKLTDLKGSPNDIGGDFYCNNNKKLTSLKGAPKHVNWNFYCSNNENLTSLKGAPTHVEESFYCNKNEKLTSLKGAPTHVGRDFICTFNENLTSLKGAPGTVGRDFDCSDNKNLTSLDGAPTHVGRDFDCSNNPVELDYKKWLAKQQIQS